MTRPAHRRRRALLATVGVTALLGVGPTSTVAARPDALGAPLGATQARLALAARCPWATATATKRSSPSALAAEVVARMTLSEKLGLVNLANANGYENQNIGVPRLCIPPLTLQDSPNGLANGVTQVTQLPALAEWRNVQDQT